MPNSVRHLALNADDVQRAKAFYETVFGWRFEPWGPPDFYQAHDTGGPTVALHGRRELTPGGHMRGFEATKADIEAAGGRIVMPQVYIDGVGKLIYFEDPEGNLVGAMQYDPDAH